MSECFTNLYVLHRHKKIVEDLLRKDHAERMHTPQTEDDFTTWFGIEEVEGGYLGIEEKLKEMKIPYSVILEVDNNPYSEISHFRILPDGEITLSQWSEVEEMTLFIDDVREACAVGIEKVKELVERHVREYTPMSWGEQYYIYNDLVGEEVRL